MNQRYRSKLKQVIVRFSQIYTLLGLFVLWVSSTLSAELRTNSVPATFTNYVQLIPGSSVSFDMVAVPGGRAILGSPLNEPGRSTNDMPQHTVTIRPFWIGRCEVTWQEYLPFVFIEDSEVARMQELYRAPIDHDGISHPSKFYGSVYRNRGVHRHPAFGMGCIAASEYCRWLSRKTGVNYRLPTEDEWEYACRAGSTNAYYWKESNPIDSAKNYAWFAQNSATDDFDQTMHAIGLLKPNAFGIFDMAGNIAEWCVKIDKNGPNVVRGGSFMHPVSELRCAARLIELPEWDELDPELPRSPWWLTAEFVGFRVARSLETNAIPIGIK